MILVLAVAGIAVLAIYFKTSVKKIDQTVSTQTEQSPPYWETGSDEKSTSIANADTPTPTIPDPYGFEIPQLPAGFGWTIVSTEDSVLNKLNWKEVGSDEFYKNEVALEGTEWRALITYNSKEDPGPEVNPRKYFRDFLSERRWNYSMPSLVIDKYEFTIFDAMGPLSGEESYYKEKGDLIRVVSFSRDLDKRYWTGGLPGEYSYPYSVEYRFFASDIIPRAQIVRHVTKPSNP